MPARIPYRSRRFSHLRRCQSGVTALEFAFVAPVLLLLVMGIVEFSLIMFTTTVMESATNITGRLGKTGYAETGSSRQEQIVQSVKDRTAGLLDPEKIAIDFTVYEGMDTVNQPEPYTDSNGNGMYSLGEPYTDVNGNGQWDADMGMAGVGNANDVVVYTVSYPWPIMTPLLQPMLGSTYPITVRTVVKNEPYDF